MRLRRCLAVWAGNRKHLVLLAHVSNGLKLVPVPVWLGLIRLAWGLNLLFCFHYCHDTSTFYIHSLMRLYEIFKPLPGEGLCVFVYLLPLYSCIFLGVYQQFLISLLAVTNAAREETDTGAHFLHTCKQARFKSTQWFVIQECTIPADDESKMDQTQ